MNDSYPELTPENLVSSLYQAVLGRNPDQIGLSHYSHVIREGCSLESLIRIFLTSPERQSEKTQDVFQLDGLPPNPIGLHLSEIERQTLWARVRDVWCELGTTEPYWSVITADRYRRTNMSDNDIDHFYATGRFDIERAERYLARHGRTLPTDGSCIDYGCGIGRCTYWLAQRCRHVVAIDVSESHMALARRNLAARGVTNVDFRLLRNEGDLGCLAGADLFYSMIALQHNPPPLIAQILTEALKGLRSGGHAFFQVPTYAIGYSWEYRTHLRALKSGRSLEMHVLPQRVVFQLAAQHRCVPLEVQPDFWVGNREWISNVFLLEKSTGFGE